MQVSETIVDSLHCTDFVVDAFEFAVGFMCFYGYQFQQYESNTFPAPVARREYVARCIQNRQRKHFLGTYLFSLT